MRVVLTFQECAKDVPEELEAAPVQPHTPSVRDQLHALIKTQKRAQEPVLQRCEAEPNQLSIVSESQLPIVDIAGDRRLALVRWGTASALNN